MQLFIRLATFRTLHWSHSSEFFDGTWEVLLKLKTKKKIFKEVIFFNFGRFCKLLKMSQQGHVYKLSFGIAKCFLPKWHISAVVCIRARSLVTSKGAELVLYWRGAKNTRQISRHLAGVSSIANNLQPNGTPALKSHFYHLWAALLLRPHMNTQHFESYPFSVG